MSHLINTCFFWDDAGIKERIANQKRERGHGKNPEKSGQNGKRSKKEKGMWKGWRRKTRVSAIWQVHVKECMESWVAVKGKRQLLFFFFFIIIRSKRVEKQSKVMVKNGGIIYLTGCDVKQTWLTVALPSSLWTFYIKREDENRS